MQTEDSMYMLHTGHIDPFCESDLEEENCAESEKPGLLEKRRKLHTEAEQRRRNLIKRGYEVLAKVVDPRKNDSTRMNKTKVVQQASSTIDRLTKQIRQITLDIDNSTRKVKTLCIMNSIYEKMFQEQLEPQRNSIEPISEEFKLHVFQLFADELFRTFDSVIQVSPFTELSGSAVNWLENNCQSVQLSDIMNAALKSAIDTTYSKNVEDCSNSITYFDKFPKNESSQSLFTTGPNAEWTISSNSDSGPQSTLTASSTTTFNLNLRTVVDSDVSRHTPGIVAISDRGKNMDTSYPIATPSTLPSTDVSTTCIVKQSTPNRSGISHGLLDRNPKQIDFRATRGRVCEFARSLSLSSTQPSLLSGAHSIEPMRVDQGQSNTLVSVMSAAHLSGSIVDSHESIRIRQPLPSDIRQRPRMCTYLKNP